MSDRPTKRAKHTKCDDNRESTVSSVAADVEKKLSPMDQVRAEDIGSTIAQFLPFKSKIVLASTSHRWAKIVNYPKSWNPTLRITSEDINGMKPERVSNVLCRPELRALTIDVLEYSHVHDMTMMMLKWISQCRLSNITSFTLIIDVTAGISSFIFTMLKWAPHLQVLKISNFKGAVADVVDAISHTTNGTADEKNVPHPSVHTLQIRCSVRIDFLIELIKKVKPTLRTLDVLLNNFKLNAPNFRRLISSIPLTSLEIELHDFEIDVASEFYAALDGAILQSLQSTGCSMDLKNYTRFPNLRHAICEHSSEVKEAVHGIAKLDRLTILLCTRDSHDFPAMMALLSSKMSVPDRIRLEFPLATDPKDREVDLECIEQIATARGGKVVLVSANVCTIQQ